MQEGARRGGARTKALRVEPGTSKDGGGWGGCSRGPEPAVRDGAGSDQGRMPQGSLCLFPGAARSPLQGFRRAATPQTFVSEGSSVSVLKVNSRGQRLG